MKRWYYLSTLSFLAACGETSPDPVSETPEVPTQYVFASRFGEGSSVTYSGQVLRHVLSQELKKAITGLTARIDNGDTLPDVSELLMGYYAFDAASAAEDAHSLSTTPPALQSTYGELSTSAQLRNKIAGNDPTGQHADWSTAFVGPGASPDALVLSWFDLLETRALAYADGASGEAFEGVCGEALPVHVTPEGVDLGELVQKFVDGAVAFSQATDDYLDDDLDNHGLNADNTVAAEGQLYTALEHHWDEAFGYFGAARDYADYTDDEVRAASGRDAYKKGYHDTDGDGFIDLKSEYNFGHSTNAAKRDAGSKPGAKTDFTKSIFEAFVRGRALITGAGGALSAGQKEDLLTLRDTIVLDWERVLAASALHYINEVLKKMTLFGDCEAYDFVAHAKAWSELKGFALVLQFNPRSPLSDADFVALHAKLGDAPVLPTADAEDIAAYKVALREARALLRDAYDFADANVGDDNGEGGW